MKLTDTNTKERRRGALMGETIDSIVSDGKKK